MKKTVYLAPATEILKMQMQSLLNSVSGVKGDTGIGMGDDTDPDKPKTGDSRRYDIWTDPEEDEEENF